MSLLKEGQRGSVIIVVLWVSVLLTILVTVMAGKVQLSARTAHHNQVAVDDLARISSTMNLAEMQILLEQMSLPVGEEVPRDDQGYIRSPLYRFNGRELALDYPADEGMTVRIYNHAGKINLNGISLQDLRLLIEHRLGDDADPDQVQALLAAWSDWTDPNDSATVNGAERDYYESLDPPYLPRNSPQLESVDEILLIRGFAELFEGVNLEAAFTVYGNGRQVNLNYATREAMQLLPGLNDELIELILAYREHRDLRNTTMVGDIVPLENFVELAGWIGNTSIGVFSVYAYPKPEAISDGQEGDEEWREANPVTQAYMEIMMSPEATTRPRVLKVDPYARLPDSSPPRVEPDALRRFGIVVDGG